MLKGDHNLDQFGRVQNDSEDHNLEQVNQPDHQQSEFDTIGKSPKKIISFCAMALFVLAVVAISVQTMIELLVMIFKPSIADADWYIWVLTAFSLIIVGFPIYYLILKNIPDTPKGEVVRLKFSQFIVIFFICAAAMYITSFFGAFITLLISYIKGEELINPAYEAIMKGNFLMAIIYAAIIAPIFEEFIFRKLLLNKLRRFGDIPAILMTGIAFGLFHMNLSQIFYATVLGFIFAYVAIRTNTIKYTILLHMIINLIGTLATPLITKGHVIGIILFYFWIILALTLGSVLYLLNYKKIIIQKGTPILNRSAYFLNPGTILYVLVCTAMIVISTVR